MPSVIDQATILPSLGATNSLRLAATRVWNAVVREITSHGLVGQLGGNVAPMSPTSMILAEAVAGQHEQRRHGRQEQPRGEMPEVPVHARIEHEQPVDVAVRAAASPAAAPTARQTFCTLTAFGPFSPFSSS